MKTKTIPLCLSIAKQELEEVVHFWDACLFLNSWNISTDYMEILDIKLKKMEKWSCVKRTSKL